MTRFITATANRLRRSAAGALLPLAILACDPPGSTKVSITKAPTEETKVIPAGGLPPAASGPVTPAPLTGPVTYGDAESLFKAGKYVEAKELFENYVESKPENPWGHYMLGLTAWKSGDFKRAARAFDRALELDSTLVKGYLNSARVLMELDRDHEAVERIDAALERDSTSSEALRLLARAQAKLGAVEAALDTYRHALVLDDQDLWAMNNLGLLYLEEGNAESALGPLARAVELKATAPVFQNNLGVALERTGHPVQAKHAYQAAVKADSTYGKAVKNLDRIGKIVADSLVDDGVFVKEQADQFRLQVELWKDSELEPVKDSLPPKPVKPDSLKDVGGC